MHTLHLTYRAEIHNAHSARQDVYAFLSPLTTDAVWLFNAMLIVDELFMNSVMHGSTTEEAKIDVCVEVGSGQIQIEVCDEGAGQCAADIYAHLQEAPKHPYGRGLRVLVTQLATACEIVDRQGGGICIRVKQLLPE